LGAEQNHSLKQTKKNALEKKKEEEEEEKR
jgi:hypothetical protein